VNVLLVSPDRESGENLQEGIMFANLRIRELEKEALFLFEMLQESLQILFQQLNKKQQLIFIETASLLSQGEYSINKLSEIISKKLGNTFSSTKWNLTQLRKKGLFLMDGNRGNTKTTLYLSDIGSSLFSLISQKSNKN